MWQRVEVPPKTRLAKLDEQIENMINHAEKLQRHLERRMQKNQSAAESIGVLARVRRQFDEWIKKSPEQTEHVDVLRERIDAIRSEAAGLRARSAGLVNTPAVVVREADTLLEQTALLKKQTPTTLLRLRYVEIGLPLALSCVSILLTLRYPLTEARWREIKEALDTRHAERVK